MSLNALKYQLFHYYSHFGNGTIFVYFSWRPLWICYGARYVHFIVPLGRTGTLFFLMADVWLCQGYWWIGQKQTRKSALLIMVFIMVFPICFWFQWMSLCNLFVRLLILRKFVVLVVVVWLLILRYK